MKYFANLKESHPYEFFLKSFYLKSFYIFFLAAKQKDATRFVISKTNNESSRRTFSIDVYWFFINYLQMNSNYI